MIMHPLTNLEDEISVKEGRICMVIQQLTDLVTEMQNQIRQRREEIR